MDQIPDCKYSNMELKSLTGSYDPILTLLLLFLNGYEGDKDLQTPEIRRARHFKIQRSPNTHRDEFERRFSYCLPDSYELRAGGCE